MVDLPKYLSTVPTKFITGIGINTVQLYRTAVQLMNSYYRCRSLRRPPPREVTKSEATRSAHHLACTAVPTSTRTSTYYVLATSTAVGTAVAT